MNKKVFIGILLGLWACKKDVPPPGGGGGIGSGQGVFVSNEGNFQAGNAGVSYFEEGFQEALADVFAPANNRPLGDVLQSMTFHNGRCYLVVNNSGKVEVVDAQTFKSEATMVGFTSPRYLLPVGNGKAYVSDLYGNALSVVDLTTHQRVGSIPCQGWTEEMVLADGRVFVTNRSNAFLLVVDPQTDAIADTVVVGHGANSIRQDGAGKVWVLCSGNGANAAALYRINPGSLVVEAVFSFQAGAGPGRLNMNGGGDTLYYLQEDVFRMPVSAAALPATAFIPANGRTFYGLGHIRPK